MNLAKIKFIAIRIGLFNALLLFVSWVIWGATFISQMRFAYGSSSMIILTSNSKREALRVIPRGKQRLTVYRAYQVQIKRACQNSWQLGPKNEDFSKSVSSICRGAIFPTRLGQDLSRDAFVVSGYAF